MPGAAPFVPALLALRTGDGLLDGQVSLAFPWVRDTIAVRPPPSIDFGQAGAAGMLRLAEIGTLMRLNSVASEFLHTGHASRSAERKGINMQGDGLRSLATKVEGADEVSTALVSEVADALAAAFPDAASRAVSDAALLGSTDAALHVVDRAVPAWEISLKGVAVEPDGHWHCSLREASVTDDDEVIGFGEAPSLPRALIAALLRIAAARAGA